MEVSGMDNGSGFTAQKEGMQYKHKNGYTNPIFENDQKKEQRLIHPTAENSTNTENSTNAQVARRNNLNADNNMEATLSDSTEQTEKCGCCLCYPSCLQKLTRPICYLICICSLVFIQSMVVSGYSSGILTTIEKRYELSGSELGLVISSYDIASLTAAIVVSYYGDQKNRATWLGRGALLISLGSITFSLPYFFGGKYVIPSNLNSTISDNNVCNATVPPTPEDCDEQSLVSDKWAFGIFMGAFAIIGFGSSPIYSLGATYLYDNVKTSRYPVYAGVMYSMGALGPACGFLLAGLFVQFFVHPDSAPGNYKDDDSEWIGAWWIGFLLCASLAFLVAIPLLLFPRRLPLEDRDRNEEDKPDFASFGAQLKEFPKYMLRMVTNLTWLGISLVMVVEQSIGTGFNRFIAKYIELAFSLPSYRANVITGLVLIPAAVLGIIAGGFIMNKLKLGVIGIVRFLLLMNFIPTLAMATLFTMGCSSIDLVGITNHYHSITRQTGTGSLEIDVIGNLSASCNDECGCLKEEYEPVCGSDDRTYYSPCYAGCTVVHRYSEAAEKNFSSCACVNGSSVAKDGKCNTGCDHIEAFLVILFVVVFITCLGQNPALLITLRSVDAASRSLSLGMQNFLIQLIAFIPAPIYFGKVFDSQCILWSSTCGDDGACLEYNTETLPYVLFGTCIAFKGLTFFFLVMTYISCKCNGSKSDGYDVGRSKFDSKSPSITSVKMDSTETSITTLSYNTYI